MRDLNVRQKWTHDLYIFRQEAELNEDQDLHESFSPFLFFSCVYLEYLKAIL